MRKFFGWSKELWIRFGVVTTIFLAIPGLAYWNGYKINNALILATGLVLLLYTIETQGMRLEMARQNETSIQPILIARIEKGADNRNRMVLRNIGRGPALFIQLMDIKLSPEVDASPVARFDKIDYIEPKEREVAHVKTIIEEPGETSQIHVGWGEDSFVAALNPKFAGRTYQITISYEDINAQKRQSVMQMGKGGIRLLSHGKN